MAAKKRAKIEADQERDIFGRSPQDRAPDEPRRERDEEEYAQRYGRPTTYRLPDDVREAMRDLADREQVPISELAEVALRRFLADVEAGRFVLRKEPTGYTLKGE